MASRDDRAMVMVGNLPGVKEGDFASGMATTPNKYPLSVYHIYTVVKLKNDCFSLVDREGFRCQVPAKCIILLRIAKYSDELIL